MGGRGIPFFFGIYWGASPPALSGEGALEVLEVLEDLEILEVLEGLGFLGLQEFPRIS